MNKMTTREFFDRCFSDETMPDSLKMRKANIDKPLLFNYEKEIGKQLMDMDDNEMTELIFRYAKGEAVNQPYISSSYVAALSAYFKHIINWYTCNVNPSHKNVFVDSPKLKGRSLLLAIIDKAGRITWEQVKIIIDALHKDMDLNNNVEGLTRADYIEMLMLLFYSGFRSAEEIVEFKEVDIENKSVTLSDRTIPLTDRALKLITAFHIQNALSIPNGNSIVPHPLVSWHDSYFKFYCMPSKVDSFDDRSFPAVSNFISYNIKHCVGDKYQTGICASSLFWLGVHDRLAAIFGEEKLSNVILNDDKTYTQQLGKALRDSALFGLSLSVIKNNLMQFIKIK